MCYNIGGEILSRVWESLIPVKSGESYRKWNR